MSLPGHSPSVLNRPVLFCPFSSGEELGAGKRQGPDMASGIVLPLALWPHLELILCAEALDEAGLPGLLLLSCQGRIRWGGGVHHKTPRVPKRLV